MVDKPEIDDDPDPPSADPAVASPELDDPELEGEEAEDVQPPTEVTTHDQLKDEDD